ncbi:diguanylate cyclase domain-containing protein [Vreelandella rituensis]|uniref:diguanylate cyclase domain-containing protein n=1 Tax=Vreelandella rituensis TaxID=2282306 RepID=UPI0022873346|nr:diguanylate cyclase [Halomonas rituensis]
MARYGGEEFVALLSGTDAEGASWVAERLREAILTLVIPHAHSSAADNLRGGTQCNIPSPLNGETIKPLPASFFLIFPGL